MKPTFRRVVLKPESGVAIHRSRASSQFTPTLDYLPGSAIRGAYAEIFINKHGVKDEAFRRIFVDSKVHFGDFYPSNVGEPEATPFLLPASAVACKRYKLKHKSLRDTLIHTYSNIKGGKDSCLKCGEPLDRAGGSYLQEIKEDYEAVEFGQQLRMHVGVSRNLGSAVQGLLFSHQLLTPKTDWQLFFVGTLTAPADETEEIFKVIDAVVGREHLSIGAARTRGLGEFVIRDDKPFTHEDDFAARWDAFNRKIPAAAGTENKCFFSLTLFSHLKLRDPIGMPVLDGINAKHLGLPEACHREVAFLNRAVVSGWNAAQGLPKPDAVAIARGSVMLFSAPKYLEKETFEQLKNIELEGIGERRSEGFGAISVCHPFHALFAKE